jgi:hypothetical protein
MCSLAVRMAVIFGRRTYLVMERNELVRVAMSLLDHGTLADAYGAGSGPTAHVMPLYPIALSLLFRVFGTGVAGQIAQEVFSSFGASISNALLPWAADRCGLGRRAGVIAGLAAALFPVNFWSQTKGSFETAYGSLLLMMASVLTIVFWRGARPSVAGALSTGAIWGIAHLTSSAVLPVLAGILAVALMIRSVGFRQWLRLSSVQALAVALVVLPWAVRNHFTLGKAIWSRSNLGLELRISFNDWAEPDMQTHLDRGVDRRFHPFVNREELARVAAMGEVAYHQAYQRQAVDWIRRHPERAAWLVLRRVVHFWFPQMARPLQTALLALLSVVALAGFLVLATQRHHAVPWLASILLTYPLVYYVVQAFPRYRYGVEWVLWLLSGVAAAALAEPLVRRTQIHRHLVAHPAGERRSFAESGSPGPVRP